MKLHRATCFVSKRLWKRFLELSKYHLIRDVSRDFYALVFVGRANLKNVNARVHNRWINVDYFTCSLTEQEIQPFERPIELNYRDEIKYIYDKMAVIQIKEFKYYRS